MYLFAGQYDEVFYHKLRELIAQQAAADEALLGGEVEAGESYFGSCSAAGKIVERTPRMIYVSRDVETLHRDGITGLKGAFSRDWVEIMREDMMTAFWSAIQRLGGAVGRGPRRKFFLRGTGSTSV